MELLELKVSEYQIPEVITCNYEEILAFVDEKCKLYSTTVYTEEQIKQCRADRAALNRLAESLNNERKKREKDYMAPFMPYREQTETLVKRLKAAAEEVGKYDAAYKEKCRQEKREKIESYLDQCGCPDFVNRDKLFADHAKWLNASTSAASIKKEITELIDGIEKDLATLAELPEYGFEAVEMYKDTLDINRAIQEGKRLAAMAKLAEQARQEARHEMQIPERPIPEVEETTPPEAVEQLPELTAETPAVDPDVELVADPAERDKRVWMAFQALLNVEDAKALHDFFASRGIEFEAI